MLPVVIVVPCYNEAERLDIGKVRRLLGDARVTVLFVDDGSTDATAALLDQLGRELGSRVDTLRLPQNQGKAEAVRAGLAHALTRGAELLGYLDADFATPPDEALRLVAALADKPAVGAVIAARIAHMGADIRRSPLRHYLGRIFASAASLVLDVSIYDTQCGAKFFRASPALAHALEQPFCSRWAFDVELLGRYLLAGGTAIEVPLKQWSDVSGSKLHPRSMVRAGLDLIVIAQDLRRRRRTG